MGRPSKLTPETQEKICQSIRLGSTYKLACNAAGISYDIFRNWMRQGEGAKTGKFLQFYNAIKKAEGDAADKWLKHIEEAAQDGNWQAAAWKLERRYPDNFAKRTHQQIKQETIEIDLNSLSDDQLKRLANGEPIASILADKK